MLNPRKRKILQAIVDEYINTAEPVSSGSIVQKYGLDFSSATIRNEMADLEKSGYIEKTHTSSGRIPSALGYRLYVNELIKDDNISLEEIKYIQSKLSTKVNEIEDLTKITSQTLSEVTHYTSVAVGPRAEEQKIQEIKFDEDINEEQVETLNYIFNNKLKGKLLEEINQPLKQYILSQMDYSVKVIKPVLEQLNKVVNENNDKIYLDGANRIFDLPEFKSLDVAKRFINLIDTKEIVLDLLNTGFANDINVYIGDESKNKELQDFSIVTFRHKYKNKDLGTIGIIGPKRMDYSKVISVMKYISKKLNEK